ncbi:MAG: hypothetical protein EB127_21030 [Alphaproteobacteria bacterium]|nr:hypothetical protein [Alphaproteobacteria bacterium]
MSKKSMKEWDNIMRNISSPENSDADDDVNILSIQRSTPKVVQLMQHIVPGLSANVDAPMPMGMNSTQFIRDGISSTVNAVSDSHSQAKMPEHSESHNNVVNKNNVPFPKDDECSMNTNSTSMDVNSTEAVCDSGNA